MNKYIQIHRLIENTLVEGPGNRFAMWVQGCSLRCEGCFEKNIWNKSGGRSVAVCDLAGTILKNDSCEGITILGGEPFEQAESLCILLKSIHEQKNVIVFSGYTYEELKEKKCEFVNEMLKYTDLLIDGRFLEAHMDLVRPLVGSVNQRFIPLNKTGDELMERMKYYKDSIELRIAPSGVVLINGMWK